AGGRSPPTTRSPPRPACWRSRPAAPPPTPRSRWRRGSPWSSRSWRGWAGPAPRAATPERYAAGRPLAGPLAVSVPGSVAAWAALHARFGRRPWPTLFAAAIHYARAGFGATRAYRHFAGEQRAALRADPRSARVFLRDGEAPPLGALVVQRDLARTLERLAAEG